MKQWQQLEKIISKIVSSGIEATAIIVARKTSRAFPFWIKKKSESKNRAFGMSHSTRVQTGVDPAAKEQKKSKIFLELPGKLSEHVP